MGEGREVEKKVRKLRRIEENKGKHGKTHRSPFSKAGRIELHCFPKPRGLRGACLCVLVASVCEDFACACGR